MIGSLLAGTVLLLVACGPAATPRPAEAESRPGTLLPADRLLLPEFAFDDFQSLLAELRGTPVVVNIWASWCAPCLVEAPDLARVSREFEGAGAVPRH